MIDKDVLLWLWIQQRLGFASRYSDEILLRGKAELFYASSESELRRQCALPDSIIRRLFDRDLSDAEKIADECERLGYQIITPESPAYPKRLRHISSPPLVLYVLGTLPTVDDELCIGIVGTRNASQRGIAAAQELGMRLGRTGAIIVSGCAVGIDSASQQGAIMADGRTVGVLGCGINTRYNARGKELRKLVALHGALVTEYPPSYPALPQNFVQRNRIISGLSNGVAVIEAGERSGSTVTARFAVEQGRDLFAMPGVVGTENAVGVNRLLRDGAILLTSPRDILSVYERQFAHKLWLTDVDSQLLSSPEASALSPERPKSAAQSKPAAESTEKAASDYTPLPEQLSLTDLQAAPKSADLSGLSEKAVSLYNAVTATPEPLDAIAARAGLTASEAARCILELELNGAVTSHAGGCYSF